MGKMGVKEINSGEQYRREYRVLHRAKQFLKDATTSGDLHDHRS